MSRRATTPPQGDSTAYLASVKNSGFASVQPQGTVEGSYEDDYTTDDNHGAYQPPSRGVLAHNLNAPPSYASGGPARTPPPPTSSYGPPPPIPIHASPFARPEAPEEGEFHWTDDASTIRPGDSVSQLGRAFTGKKKVMGPRPLPSSDPITEDPEPVESYQWVPPEMLKDDRSTVVGGGVGGSGGAPQASYAQQQQSYYPEEEEDPEVADAYRSSSNLHGRERSSVNEPLVPGAAPIAGFQEGSMSGSNVKPYQGYAAVGADEDAYVDPYEQYSRTKERDLESRLGSNADVPGGGNGGIRRVGSTAMASALSYARSFKQPHAEDASSYGGGKSVYGENSYPPTGRGFQGPTDPEDPSMMKHAPLLQRWIYDTTPLPLKIEDHKKGLGVQRYPVASWILAVICTAVMIYEFVHMAAETGSPIQTKPSVNVMIGPSGSVLINMGARFAGCIKFISNVSDIDWVCLPYTNLASSSVTSQDATCSMSDICGFGGFPTESPNQSFRFFVPIFLHAGIVHLALNMIALLVSSAQVERQMGTPKFLLLFLPAGIFGFVLGANFALVGQPSVGASGAIFGTHAAILVDLFAHWSIEYQPKRKLFYLILEIVVGLALGLVPGVDNFAHIGGFLIGLLMAIVLFPMIHQTKRHRIICIVLRVIAAPLVVVLFVVLIRNFYETDPSKACSWCRYLSCWPTSSNNHCKGTGLSTVSTSSFDMSPFFGYLLPILPLLSPLVLLVTFVLGGITFIPLCLATFAGLVFFTSPIVHLPHKTGIPQAPTNDDAAAVDSETEAVTVVYRAGWLTVRRSYQPLLGGEGTYVGALVSGYRSFMDQRSRDPRRSKPKDRFFAVLKQNTLFLYDTEEMVDCWAAIEVSAHDVLLYPEDGIDGELFAKRNSMCLKPKAIRGESLMEWDAASEETTHDMEASKPLPWFLFAKVNSDKEDWYFSLVQASKLTGGPTEAATLAKDRSIFDQEDMARLVDGIDQQPDSIPVRWMNAMLGRIFLSVYRTASLEDYITSRIVKKLKRVKTPSMLSEVQVREVNMGSTAPFFSKPMLKELTVEGDASMEVHASYVGEMRITIETVATINLGSRFKPYSVRLVLAVVLKELEGTMLLKMKKPPSNRLWFGFTSMPRMVLNVEPVVSTRQIKWSLITSPIESRIREIVLESIVAPHFDDIAFFDSRKYLHRAGIWGDALRKEKKVNTTTGGAGDESTAIGQEDPVVDEAEVHPGEAVLSTGRDEVNETTARQRPRRRRSSEGDQSSSTFAPDVPPSSTKGSTSSLSSFSLSSWRDGKKETSAGAGTLPEKKRSWFGSQSRSATGSPSSAGTLSRTTTSSDASTISDPSGSTAEQDLSASRLRDILTKRAKDREKEKEAARPTTDTFDDVLTSTPPVLSALSLTAPGKLTDSPTRTPSPASSERSIRSTVGEISIPTSSNTPAVSTSRTESHAPSVPDVTLEAPTPTDTTSRLSYSAPESSPTISHDMGPPPVLPSRPVALPSAPPPPPRRISHQTTQSADAGSSSFASAATTASILSSWRSKAADKQAIAAGVASAKDTMNRWGARWNARKGAQVREEDDVDGTRLGEAAASPPQDMGHSLPTSRSRSTSPSRNGASTDSYRDYRASRAGTSDYFGGNAADAPVTSLSEPVSINGSPRRTDSAGKTTRRVSVTSSFAPGPSQPTTKLNTAPTFAPGSPPAAAPAVPRKDPPVSSSPPVARTYKPATMMAIPGIVDSTRRKAVASDHVSAAEVEAAGTTQPAQPEPKDTELAPTNPPPTLPPRPVSPAPSGDVELAPSNPPTALVPPTTPPRPTSPSAAPLSEPSAETPATPIAKSVTKELLTPATPPPLPSRLPPADSVSVAPTATEPLELEDEKPGVTLVDEALLPLDDGVQAKEVEMKKEEAKEVVPESKAAVNVALPPSPSVGTDTKTDTSETDNNGPSEEVDEDSWGVGAAEEEELLEDVL